MEGIKVSDKTIKRRKFIILILTLVIILTAIFLYLFLTRNPLLWDIPFLPKGKVAPAFLYALQGNPNDPLDSPMGIAVDDFGRVYVTDMQKHRILVFDNLGSLLFSFGEKGKRNGHLDKPYGIAVYNARVYVAETGNDRIQVFSDRGAYLETLISSDSKSTLGSFSPVALTVNQENGDIYFTDIAQHRIVVLDNKGNVKETFGQLGNGKNDLAYPNGIALDDRGNIYVSDSNNGRIQVYSANGEKVLRSIDGGKNNENQLSLPRGVYVDGKGNIWVIDTITHSVHVFNGSNRVLKFGELGVEEGELYFPNGLTMDKKGTIYITERGMNRISVFGYKKGIRR